MAEDSKAERVIRSVELAELTPGSAKGRTLFDEHNELLKNVKTKISVSVGTCEITVRDLLELKEEAVLSLDKETREPVDVMLDGKLVARGHLVAVDDNFGVRITQIIPA
jgi:flagellar motor switch protein FliN